MKTHFLFLFWLLPLYSVAQCSLDFQSLIQEATALVPMTPHTGSTSTATNTLPNPGLPVIISVT
jgi:hypothetical protein